MYSQEAKLHEKPVLDEDRWIEVSEDELSEVRGTGGLTRAIGTFVKTPYADWALPVLTSGAVATGAYYLGKDVKDNTYAKH